MKKQVLLVGGVFTVVAALVAVVPWARSTRSASVGDDRGPAGRPQAPSAMALPVRVGIARTGSLVQYLTTSGTLRACQQIEVQARVGGTLTRVAAFDGRAVRCGDTLGILDDREYRVAFERARAGLLNAQIEFRSLSNTPFLAAGDSLDIVRRIEAETRGLDSLRRLSHGAGMDHDLYERLTRDREAALAYLTASRGDVVAGRSGLAAAREAFETAKLDLEWTSVTAPFSGVVADCALSPGMHINAGQPLMKLLDLSMLLVDVEILENETGRIAVGQHARVLLAGLPGKEITGAVLSMNPIVDTRTKTMKVTIALRDSRECPGGPQPFLRPGMFTTVHIETDVHPPCLLVPRSALLVRDERPLVFTVERGRAQWHYVETGDATDELLEIRSGLAAGDTVIVDGHYTLAHDAPVSILRRSP